MELNLISVNEKPPHLREANPNPISADDLILQTDAQMDQTVATNISATIVSDLDTVK
jgi:hypothetical protein